MKRLFFFISLLSLNFICFSQTKKELNEKIVLLSTENKKLFEEIKSIKSELEELKTEIIQLKASNDELAAKLKSNPGSSSSFISSQTNPNETKQSTSQCQAKTSSGKQCSRNVDPSSKYCWQHKSTYETSISKSESSVKTSSNSQSRIIYTGPRGGKYYINSSGKKVYIKQ